MDIKQKMIALWSETFHKSESSLRLLFDNYYNPELIEYEVRGNELIACIMGIPYEFGSENNRIKGLYLCGLTTRSRIRGEGVMTRLLHQINTRAKEKGFAFTFMVPNSQRFSAFIARRGYVDAYYHCHLNYTSLHDFTLEFETILEEQKGHVAALKKRYYDSLIGGILEEDIQGELAQNIIGFMLNMEQEQTDVEIRHSAKDFEIILSENRLSGGKIYYVKTAQGQITAVGITSLRERSCVDIYRLYSADQTSWYRLLDYVKHQEPDAGIKIYINPRKSERKNLAEMYGMAKILNLYEILKFQSRGHGDLKYSILVKSDEEGIVDRFDVKGENVGCRKMSIESEEFDSSKTVMGQRDMASVLFRRPDTGALITEAFGMPSLGGYINLLPIL